MLGEIVDELLISAQLAADPTQAQIVPVAAILDDVATSIRPLALGAGVEVVVVSGPGAEVRGSATSLRRAVLALTDNAIAHTPPGGHVRLASRLDGTSVVIEVVDDGDGIDDAQVARLTERFARGTAIGGQADGLTRRRFGLGLALVRQVVEAHGGRLVRTGRPDGGTTASMRLPASSFTSSTPAKPIDV